MPVKIVTDDHIEYAIMQKDKGKKIPDIAEEIVLKPATLYSGIYRTKTKQDALTIKITKNKKRQAIVQEVWNTLSIGQKFYFKDIKRRTSGVIFYIDNCKIGIINSSNRKEFIIRNDLIPKNIIFGVGRDIKTSKKGET
jgi:hypothetical protein